MRSSDSQLGFAKGVQAQVHSDKYVLTSMCLNDLIRASGSRISGQLNPYMYPFRCTIVTVVRAGSVKSLNHPIHFDHVVLFCILE